MSLINEALKRAEADKLRNSPYFNNLTVLPPAEDEVPPPSRPQQRRPPEQGFRTLHLLVVVLIVAAGTGGLYLWSRYKDQAGPSLAAASVKPAAPRPAAAADLAQRLTQAAKTARAIPAAVAKAEELAKQMTEGRANVQVSKDAELAFAQTMEQMRYYQPEALPAGAASAARQLLDSAHAGAEGQAASPAAGGPSARSALSPSRAARAAPGGPQPSGAAHDPTRQPAPAISPAASPAAPSSDAPPAPPAGPAPPRLDPTKFRVSAIMRGPGGNVALINGGLYREGQAIQDAKITKIGQYEVELERAGQRFTIRM